MRPFSIKLARLVGRRDFEGAIAYVRSRLKNDRSDLASWDMIAHLQTWAGRPEEAVEACQKALRLDPNYFEAHAMLAQLLSKSGAHEDAARHARRGLECFSPPFEKLPSWFDRLLPRYGRSIEHGSKESPNQTLERMDKKKAEWFEWAQHYLSWYDLTFADSVKPRPH
jgi:tetratricopeptide (TPR) repeat protein